MSRGRVAGGKAAAAGGSRLARDNLIKKAERATVHAVLTMLAKIAATHGLGSDTIYHSRP